MLVLRHDEADGPALISGWLHAGGFREHVLDVRALRGFPDPDRFALVVAMGSDECALDTSLEWLEPERSFLLAAHAAGVPVIGVCFGAQLLARALGGGVVPNAVVEIGWSRVDTRAPLLIPPGPWFQWHYDSIIAPPEADVLAGTPDRAQAFALGSSLGLQFHPEVDVSTVRRWIELGSAQLVHAGIDERSLLTATEAHSPAAGPNCHYLLARIWERVAAGP